MVSLVVGAFAGRFPRLGRRLLEERMAVEAVNLRALSGYIVGRGASKEVYEPVGSPKFVYPIYSETYGDLWLEFASRGTKVVRAPIVNDTFERYYWTETGNDPPYYNTAERISNGDPPFALGAQRQTGRVSTVVYGTGDPDDEVDRLYVYTTVDIYGHESRPSYPKKVSNVQEGQSVDITFPPRDAYPSDKAPLEFYRLYRSVPGVSSTDFFFVADVPIPAVGAAAFYTDENASEDVSLNNVLESEGWASPPNALQDLTVLPNGFLAGFRGRDIYFSEPFRPHAWPTEYVLTVEDDIVGLGVFGTNLVILTTGTPFIASGVNPAAMSLITVGPHNGCLSRTSIVQFTTSVVYASEDGLIAVTTGGQQNVTSGLIDRNTWVRDYKPEDIYATRDGDTTYIAFIDSPSVPDNEGFEIDLANVDRGVIDIDFQQDDVEGLSIDTRGRRALIVGTEKVWEFATSDADPVDYTWTSKEFFMAKPLNMGAAQVNTGDHIFPAATPPTSVEFTLWADGNEVFTSNVVLDKPFKLPSGYKAQVFKFRLRGTVTITRVAMAETERELANV